MDGERARDVISPAFCKAFDTLWSLTTSFSLNRNGMDLKEGLLDGLRSGWPIAAKGL